jgi:DNA-binding NarL/FixJ family response regulator
MTPSDQIRFSILDGNVPMRESLAKIIDYSPGYQCLSRHDGVADALRMIPRLKPDVVLVGFNLRETEVEDFVRQVKQLFPPVKIIKLMLYQNEQQKFKLMAGGVAGCLPVTLPVERILDAVSQIHRGRMAVDGSLARKITEYFQKVIQTEKLGKGLSMDEDRILHLLRKGYLQHEVAQQLKISQQDVEGRIRSVFEKLVFLQAFTPATF